MSNPRTAHDLDHIRHVVLDLDGTIYKGTRLFAATLPFLGVLGQRQIGVTFMTNNTSRSTAEYLTKLRGMGIEVRPDQLVTPVAATVAHLRGQSCKRIFVLGTAALRAELDESGFAIDGEENPDASAEDRPDAVVVGFDSSLTYSRLCRAAWWIDQGVPFVATHPDFVCPTDAATVLVDCGAICAALSAATGRTPDVTFGKPDPAMLQVVAQRNGIPIESIAMVGDRLYTDIAMANRAGATSVLVLTGEATTDDVAALPADSRERPSRVCADLAAVGALLLGA